MSAVKGRYVTDKEYIVVQVFVGQPAEFPVVRERAVTLQPGREHFLEMSGYTVTTDQEAESLDVQYRSNLVLSLSVIHFMYHFSLFTMQTVLHPGRGPAGVPRRVHLQQLPARVPHPPRRAAGGLRALVPAPVPGQVTNHSTIPSHVTPC